MTMSKSIIADFPDYNYLHTSSGTCALYLALRAIRQQRGGGEIIVPSTVCPSVPLAILWAGLTPRFCDVELESFCMSEKTISACLDANSTAKVHGIIFVYLFGKNFPSKAIIQKLKSMDIAIIEDLCQSVGGATPEKNGVLGDFTILSFNTKKILQSLTGGALLTRDSADATFVALEYSSLPIFKDDTEMRNYSVAFRDLTMGWFALARAQNLKSISAFPASILDQFRKLFLFKRELPNDLNILDAEYICLADERKRRHQNYLRYAELLKQDVPYVRFSPEEMCWRLPLLMPSASAATEVIDSVRARGALISDHYFPTSLLFGDHTCTAAEEIGRRAINLWVDSKLNPDWVPWICETINSRF